MGEPRYLYSTGKKIINLIQCLLFSHFVNNHSRQVYIHDGQIFLVQNSPSNTNTVLPVSVALQKIRHNARLYKGPDTVVECIKQRFADSMPENALHRTTVYMPVSSAWILKNNPHMISAAVRAFCNRDTIDMKSCRAMKHFPPEMRVYTQITFTRCLYAMLTYQNYTPDKRIGWNLPHKNHETFKAHSLGMKVACGLEILASQARSDGDVEDEKDWHLFLERLNANNYFDGNIEHSKGYCQRLEKAKEYFKMFSENHTSLTGKIAQEINNQLRNFSSANDQFNVNEMQAYNPIADNNEDWLNISPDDLDKMLAQRYGIKKTLHTDTDDDVKEAYDLSENLENFLNQKSEYDGVDYRPIFKEHNATPDNNPTEKKTNDNTIDFNPDAFQNHLNEMLDFVIPEDNFDSHSDSMSDFDDDAIDRNIQAMIENGAGSGKQSSNTTTNDIASYMEQMDRELAATTIGKSFQTKTANANASASANVKESDDDDDFDDIESFKPVDIDVNALQNLAASYQAQIGGHGPTASLLNSLGIRIDATQKIPSNKTGQSE